MKNELNPVTLGVIVGNRGFFPSHLCDSGRKTILSVLEQESIEAICLTPEDTSYGAVFSLEDFGNARTYSKHIAMKSTASWLPCPTLAKRQPLPMLCAGLT